MANSNQQSNPVAPGPSGQSGQSGRRKNNVATFAAYGVALVGVALIVVASVYIYSNSRSGSDADEFTQSISSESLDNHLGRVAGAVVIETIDGEQPIPLELLAPDVARFASLYPGDLLNPKYWAQPEWAGSDPFGGPTIPDDFIPVPSINLNSTVAELAIIDLDDQRSYQTPDNTVGHIPETSAPGQQGSGWFFGHLESFAAGEGSIFRHLPDIAALIKLDPVDVYIETSDSVYMYRVTSTSQIHESELHLTSSDDAQITLVTCWPPRVYDQRVLVDATLIAYRPL